MSKGYLDMDLLRFTTAGSVDDGKSTLIGRLLYDSKSIFDDHLEAIERVSAKTGDGELNLALLTDGLRAEREQGITIDVAYRYFATPKRKFIIADTPGHLQYTRNMVTGASSADLAIILIDARQGILEQTRRHSFIANLLGIKHIAVCINKMDLVDYKQSSFDTIVKGFESIKNEAADTAFHFIPISALKGDNVVNKSEKLSWYKGATLLQLLETVELPQLSKKDNFILPVQDLFNFENQTYITGRVAAGNLQKNVQVKIYPANTTESIESINIFNTKLESASEGESITIKLSGSKNIHRGSIVTDIDTTLDYSKKLSLNICWFNSKPFNRDQTYIVSHVGGETNGKITTTNRRINFTNIAWEAIDDKVEMNDILEVELELETALPNISYRDNRSLGSFIIIDAETNETVAAAMNYGIQ